VVTSCGHYFCEKCIMDHVRNKSDACPICSKDTHRTFNQATKLLVRRRVQQQQRGNTNKSGGTFQNEFQEEFFS
jgi:RING finger protein 113A